MKNILTIDLEDWYHANYAECLIESQKICEERVEENTIKILEYLSRYNAKATFFVLGSIAERHPDLIKRIVHAGHEIASHGFGHQLVYLQSKEEFKEDLKKAINAVKTAAGLQVKGYRAPSWSITEKSFWAWDIIQELGFSYDASVFPVKNFMYGIPYAPRFAFKPEHNGKKYDFLEIPTSTLKAGRFNIPFSGGFYFRILPYRIISFCINRLNKKAEPAVIYLHPREIDKKQPRIKLSFLNSLIHYWGIKTCEKKLERLLKDFTFTTISDYYKPEAKKHGEIQYSCI
ncbi:MAG: XrtA system polysaccharide deacetylase [Deltaproteobacteria bacterium]